MAESKQFQWPPKPTEIERKIVIGIYGIPGAGKSFLLHLLRQEFINKGFAFYEGSQLIASVTPGGLQAFKVKSEQEKVHWRQLAIKKAANKDGRSEEVAVVTGHYMFWKEQEAAPTSVITQEDLKTYTHILYLDVPADTIAKRRKHDASRNRPEESVSHLSRWQQLEKTDLRRLCYDHGILFSVVSGGPHSHLVDKVSLLFQDFQRHTEAVNLSAARVELDGVLLTSPQLKTLLVIDGDKTLTDVDTGDIFWKKASEMWPPRMRSDSLRMVFDSEMKYTHTAFRQAMLLYEDNFDEQQFNDLCKEVADTTSIYSEFVSLLEAIADQVYIGAIIVTCGLRRVWEEVLKREGLFEKIKVIGGGQLANGFVVTSDTKTELVSYAKRAHKAYVCAFGDSTLDLGMLKEADQALVIVGEEETRSKSMEAALLNAIGNDGLQAYQVIFPDTATPRLSIDKLPTIQLTEPKFVHDILRLEPKQASLHITHATSKNAAKVLMSPMRDASYEGPFLREAHRQVGHYLAIEYLTDICGIEEYTMKHVQGHEVAGYGLRYEACTLIVALMRGGEPMAFGVNDALPSAMFLHARRPKNIRHKHLNGQLCVVLVDSVVNSGKSVLEFVQHIRKLHATVRIVVVAGVVQSGAVSRLDSEACCHWNFKLIALRLSDNKFTGKGGTDTGNRLFNSMHLD